MSRTAKLSLLAGVIAAVNEAGLRNVLASTFLSVAGPATAVGFVYEVQALRHAQLAHEAADRAQYASRLADEASDAGQHRALLPSASEKAAESADLPGKIDSMLKSRAVILDTFGDDRSAVAPVYAVIIKQMLKDDEKTFETLTGKRASAASDEAARLADKEARLRDMHEKLMRLAGA